MHLGILLNATYKEVLNVSLLVTLVLITQLRWGFPGGTVGKNLSAKQGT